MCPPPAESQGNIKFLSSSFCARGLKKGLMLHQGRSNYFHLRRCSLSVGLLLQCLSFFLPSSPYTLLWDLTSSHCLTGVIMHTWHQAESPKVAARQQGGCWIRRFLARRICGREESIRMVQELASSLFFSQVDFPSWKSKFPTLRFLNAFSIYINNGLSLASEWFCWR